MAARGAKMKPKPKANAGASREIRAAFADTEAAQALLDLAMSFSPTEEDHTIAAYSQPSPKSPGKRGRKKVSTSPPKKARVDTWGLSPPKNFDPNCELKLEDGTSEELWREIVTRVRLDHSYSWPGELKEIADQRHHTGPDPQWDENYPSTTRINETFMHQDPKQTASVKKSPVSLLRKQDNLLHLRSGEKDDTNREVGSSSSPNNDVYQPDDSKYKNFNLLLKCLTNNVDDGSIENGRKRNDSLRSQATDNSDMFRCSSNGAMAENGEGRRRYDSNANDLSASSEEGFQIEAGDDAETMNGEVCACPHCRKSFSRRSYLMKHVNRMHPGSQLQERDMLMFCPACNHSLYKKNFKRHLCVCNANLDKGNRKDTDADLANCQFCGIRMRRHILVKHLAQEHCQDGMKDGDKDDDYLGIPPMGSSPYRLQRSAVSDSSTLSGSEHELLAASPVSPGRLMVCGVCCAEVRKAQLEHHVSVAHIQHVFSTPGQPTGTCPLCSIELPTLDMIKHLAEDHAMKASRHHKRHHHHQHAKVIKLKGQVAAGSSSSSSHSCKHSMLQRFLNDSTGGGSAGSGQDNDKGRSAEQCPACVGSLVTDHPLLAVVSSSPVSPPTAATQLQPPPPAKTQSSASPAAAGSSPSREQQPVTMHVVQLQSNAVDVSSQPPGLDTFQSSSSPATVRAK